MKPAVIDLFAGVGGLSLGFEMAGFEVVLANEYDPSIAAAYKANRPGVKMLVEDIAKLPVEKTFAAYEGQVDVVIGGPPCQGFSQKGKRKSIADPRNFMFRYYFEVVEKVRPRYFVIENVPNLLTTENGYFKDEIVNLFNGIGYAVSCGVLCAADFGVPQDRRRTCIMGKLGAAEPMALPRPNGARTTVWDAIGDLADDAGRLLRALQPCCDKAQRYRARKAADDPARMRQGDAARRAPHEVDIQRDLVPHEKGQRSEDHHDAL